MGVAARLHEYHRIFRGFVYVNNEFGLTIAQVIAVLTATDANDDVTPPEFITHEAAAHVVSWDAIAFLWSAGILR